MARPAKYTHDDLLDAARAAVAHHGRGATIGHVSDEVGAPTGSIYHRFASREDLFTQLWIRSVRRFQEGLFAAAELPDAHEALLTSAVHIPRYCRDHPAEALCLTLYRQPDLVTTAPEPLRDEVRHLNDRLDATTEQLCLRHYGSVSRHRLTLVATALRLSPYGLVRPYLGQDIPGWMDEAVRVSSAAILDLARTDDDSTRDR